MSTARREAVRRAAQIIGDPLRLQALLGVRKQDLQRWLAGRGQPPVDVFLKAVDIIDGAAVDAYYAVPDKSAQGARI